MGAAGTVVAGARHPYMHRTDTVDYAVVLQGSITMLLDEEDVELSAGDVVVQNGTNHAWANRGHTPCLMAFVLIDAPSDPPPGGAAISPPRAAVQSWPSPGNAGT
jgi:quercetin dioxygenase-like cupin family protein